MHNSDLRNYFQTSEEVVLPGIEERIPLPRNVWFRYDGEVPSLSANVAKTELIIRGILRLGRTRLERLLDGPLDALAIRAARHEVRTRITHIDELTAYCYEHKLATGPRAYVIAKKQGLDPVKSVFADGHESGEFLNEIDQRQFTQDALDRASVRLNASTFTGEDFADLGGLLALRKAFGRNIYNQLPKFGHRNPVLSQQVDAFLA